MVNGNFFIFDYIHIFEVTSEIEDEELEEKDSLTNLEYDKLVQVVDTWSRYNW